MSSDISNYCLEHDCGECCVRGWKVFVTEKEMKNWETNRPEILNGITSGIFNHRRRKLLKRKTLKSSEGKVQEICYFYDFEKKCLIHGDKPEMCKTFSCKYHPKFFIKILYQITHLQQ